MCKLITSYLCDKLICREVASKKALEEVGVKSSKLYVSPDSGLVVRACAPTRDSGHAGKSKMFLSVSHRMAKEWKGETSYVQAISQVCEYVKADLGADILLIPNELGAKADYDDTVTCEAVYSELADISGVQIFDSRSKSPLELKAEIAGCDLGVVSRYHSCVAALSSGVPIVVVGWHYKYGELLQHFNQKDCFVKQEGCSFELIRDKVQQVWSEREQRRDQILECYDIAHKTVFDTCRSVLGPYLD
jgi:polysaccharide pyruvyl transferase WcaK-like protein